MRFIKLTNRGYALVDDCDYRCLMKYPWYRRGYAVRHYCGKMILMHREVARRMGLDLSNCIDHVNGNKLDNRRCNLRAATQAENNRNNHVIRSNTGYKGVSKDKYGKYRSQIGFNGEAIYLGRFDTPEQAAEAYNKAAKEMFGVFAHLNIIDGVKA